jgi:threonine synthase
MYFQCSNCGKQYPLQGLDYQCECGGLFRLGKIGHEQVGKTISLGEVETPILVRRLGEIEVHLKLDYLSPTGSFKDRGAFVLINQLKNMGISEVVEDSSGNAGAAIAGYCAAAGIRCHIYLPESTSPGKIKQISAYGADVVKVPGSRDETARAILSAAKTTYYASHVYNPLFFEGTKSLAYEVYKQVGQPDYVFVPAGNGTMLLGVYQGFKELGRLPKIIAVQSSCCAPVYWKFHQLPAGEISSTVAEGIAVGQPKRIDEMIAAVRESQGDIITVDDEAVMQAQVSLVKKGIYVEPTAGVVPAGVQNYFKDRPSQGLKIVAPLTGFGLKK